ncbi:hypothetical protein GGF47_001615, partial [Coemansia sp. RSA 2524]
SAQGRVRRAGWRPLPRCAWHVRRPGLCRLAPNPAPPAAPPVRLDAAVGAGFCHVRCLRVGWCGYAAPCARGDSARVGCSGSAWSQGTLWPAANAHASWPCRVCWPCRRRQRLPQSNAQALACRCSPRICCLLL